MDASQNRQVEAIFKARLRALYDRMGQIDLTEVNVNPFLVQFGGAPLGLSDRAKAARFQISQRLERGLTGGLGSALASIAQELALGRSEESNRQLLVLTRPDGSYNVLLKSGPDSMNQLGINRARTILAKSHQQNGGAGLIGICYGAPEDVSPQTKQLSDEYRILIGQEFWTFLTGSQGTYGELLEAARKAGDEVDKEYGGDASLARLLDRRAERLGRQMGDRRQ